MSQTVFLISKSTPNDNCLPQSTLRVSIQDEKTNLYVTGKVTVEFTPEAIVEFAAGLIRWAVVPSPNVSNREADMIGVNKKRGALRDCGVYLHPLSNPFLILPGDSLPELDDPMPEPAQPEDLINQDHYVIPLIEPDTAGIFLDEKNVIRVTAQNADGTNQKGRATLWFSSEAMLEFAGALIRWAHSKQLVSGDEILLEEAGMGVRINPEGNSLLLRVSELPSVDELIRDF